MVIDSIDSKISSLVKAHETRNPYKIAKELGVIIIEEDLGEVYGYYNWYKRIKFLHINSNLSYREKLVTCAHELGHAICHPSENTPALTHSNLISEYKIEKEANYFATKLLIDGSHVDDCVDGKYDILKYYGLPKYFDRFL